MPYTGREVFKLNANANKNQSPGQRTTEDIIYEDIPELLGLSNIFAKRLTVGCFQTFKRKKRILSSKFRLFNSFFLYYSSLDLKNYKANLNISSFLRSFYEVLRDDQEELKLRVKIDIHLRFIFRKAKYRGLLSNHFSQLKD